MNRFEIPENAIPENVRYIMEKLENNGFESYVAGGAVRDSLLGRFPSDWDVCTSASPDEVARIFSEDRVIPTGLRHGTLTVLPKGAFRQISENASGEAGNSTNAAARSASTQADGSVSREAPAEADSGAVEVTTFRTEGSYSDGRHPDEVRFVKEVEQDLARRDFTVNAMAYSPKRGLRDPFGGREDLGGRILRCVGSAKRRMAEDSLRILRALRFRSVYGFRLDGETERAVRTQYRSLLNVSWERIAEEMKKLLCGEAAAQVLDEYREVFGCLIPELTATFDFDQLSPYHNRDVWQHTLAAVADVPPVFELRMAMLLHDIAKPVVFVLDDNGRGRFVGHPQKGAEMAEEILNRMRLPRRTVQRIVRLVRYHDVKVRPVRPEVRRLLALFGESGFEDLLAVKHADAAGKYEKYLAEAEERNQKLRRCAEEIIRDGDCISLDSLAVDGGDLMAAGIPEGPEIGRLLNGLLEDVMDDALKNEKPALISAAKARMK